METVKEYPKPTYEQLEARLRQVTLKSNRRKLAIRELNKAHAHLQLSHAFIVRRNNELWADLSDRTKQVADLTKSLWDLKAHLPWYKKIFKS